MKFGRGIEFSSSRTSALLWSICLFPWLHGGGTRLIPDGLNSPDSDSTMSKLDNLECMQSSDFTTFSFDSAFPKKRHCEFLPNRLLPHVFLHFSQLACQCPQSCTKSTSATEGDCFLAFNKKRWYAPHAMSHFWKILHVQGEHEGQRGQTDSCRNLVKLLRKVARRLPTLDPHLIFLAAIVTGCFTFKQFC